MGSKGSLGVVVQPQTLGRQSLLPFPSLCCPLLQLTAQPEWNPPKKPHSHTETSTYTRLSFLFKIHLQEADERTGRDEGGSGEEEIGVNSQEIDTTSSLAPTSCLQDRMLRQEGITCPGSSHGIFPLIFCQCHQPKPELLLLPP